MGRHKNKKRYSSVHPELGRINFTNHLITRCLERVFDVSWHDANYEIKSQGCRWLKRGIAAGRTLSWYRMETPGNKAILTTRKENALLVGNFVVILVLGARGEYVAKTLYEVHSCG